MIHPENINRVLLTPGQIAREVARLCGDVMPESWDMSESADGKLAVDVVIPGLGARRVEAEPSDLLLSIDDFSKMFIRPAVA
jgi:hypothetical protein